VNQGPIWGPFMKKNSVQKSRATVLFSLHFGVDTKWYILQNGMFQNSDGMLNNGTLQNGTALQKGTLYKTVHY
jgi:hypothetical protein